MSDPFHTVRMYLLEPESIHELGYVYVSIMWNESKGEMSDCSLPSSRLLLCKNPYPERDLALDKTDILRIKIPSDEHLYV